MQQNRIMVGLVALALSGCALLKANPDNDTRARTAAMVGMQAGNAACIVAVTEKPGLKPQLVQVVARGREVLASNDPTLAGITAAVAQITDARTRMYAQLGVTSVLATLIGTGVNVQTIEPGSPLAAGLGAFFDACSTALGGAV